MLPQYGAGATSTITAYETWRAARTCWRKRPPTRIESQLARIGEVKTRTSVGGLPSFFPLLEKGADPRWVAHSCRPRNHPGAAPVAVLSYAFWQSPSVGPAPPSVNRSLSMATTYTIVGVMPAPVPLPRRHGTLDRSGGTPLGPSGASLAKEHGFLGGRPQRRASRRLARNIAWTRSARRSWRPIPSIPGWFAGRHPLRELPRGRRSHLAAAHARRGGLVLLVACANVTGMLLARGRRHGGPTSPCGSRSARRATPGASGADRSLVLAAGACVPGWRSPRGGSGARFARCGRAPAVADVTCGRLGARRGGGIARAPDWRRTGPRLVRDPRSSGRRHTAWQPGERLAQPRERRFPHGQVALTVVLCAPPACWGAASCD